MHERVQHLGEEYIRLALSIDEHLPGYVDAYYGPGEWKKEAKQTGKVPLQNLTDRAARLTKDISNADGLDPQRKDFLERELTAMRMSLRLLSGDPVSLVEEVQALYDVTPSWIDESIFEESYRELDQLLPPGDSLRERSQSWRRSLEIPIDKVKELLPPIVKKLKERTHEKFDLPEEESFTVEFVSDKPWGAYNWYLGNFKSRIDFNTDLPIRINRVPQLVAHEAYPGHHTDLSIKEKKLVRGKGYIELTIALTNSPASLVAEGIATTALSTIMPDDELADWYREEILPHAGMSHIDPERMMAIEKAENKRAGVMGNLTFLIHDQHKSDEEAAAYLKRYGLANDQEAKINVDFVSDPISRSYAFTYHMGQDLLEALFALGERDMFFKRILEEPVTPSRIRNWIMEGNKDSESNDG